MGKPRGIEAEADADVKRDGMLRRIIAAIGVGIVVAVSVYLVTDSWPAAVGGGIAGGICDAAWTMRGDPWQSASRHVKLINISIIGMAIAMLGVFIVDGDIATIAFFGLFIVSLLFALSVGLRQMIWAAWRRLF